MDKKDRILELIKSNLENLGDLRLTNLEEALEQRSYEIGPILFGGNFQDFDGNEINEDDEIVGDTE